MGWQQVFIPLIAHQAFNFVANVCCALGKNQYLTLSARGEWELEIRLGHGLHSKLHFGESKFLAIKHVLLEEDTDHEQPQLVVEVPSGQSLKGNLAHVLRALLKCF